MVANAAPALAIGPFTICVFEAIAFAQVPPAVVSVNVAVPTYPTGGVQVVVPGVDPELSVNVDVWY